MRDRLYIYQAYLNTRMLAETLLRADALHRYAGKDSSHYVASAADELRELADHLGYDLVKREAVKIAASPTVTILPLDPEEEAA